MNAYDPNIHASKAVHLHELAHGLTASHLNLTKQIEVFSDGCVLGWHLPSVPPGHRMSVHLAGLGAEDYLNTGQTLEGVLKLPTTYGTDYWRLNFDHYDDADPNSDIVKATIAYDDMLETGVRRSIIDKIASRGRLRGALLALCADRSGLLAEFQRSKDTLHLTRRHLAKCRRVLSHIELEAFLNAAYD